MHEQEIGVLLPVLYCEADNMRKCIHYLQALTLV